MLLSLAPAWFSHHQASVLLTHSYHCVNCNTDQALIFNKLQLTSKKYHHSKKCCPRTNRYQAHWEEMESITDRKRKVLLAYKAKPNPSSYKPSWLLGTRSNTAATLTSWTSAVYNHMLTPMQEGFSGHGEDKRPSPYQYCLPQVQEGQT